VPARRPEGVIPSRSSSFACVAVKGILVVGKAALFAESRQNGDLGRSGNGSGILPKRNRADDSGCPKFAEEGNVVSMRDQAHAPEAGTRDRRQHSGDASFARSFDPCVSILTMLSVQNTGRWGVQLGIAVGQTCASRRNRHRDWGERALRGSPRITAPARERAWCERKGRRSRPPSLRGSRARVRSPHVETQLQKSVGDVRSRISSAYALQKERQGGVNGDLARGASWRVKPSLAHRAKRRFASRPHR